MITALITGTDAMLSPEYYLFAVPRWLRQDPRTLRPEARREMDRFSSAQLYAAGERPLLAPMMQRILPAPVQGNGQKNAGAPATALYYSRAWCASRVECRIFQ